MTTSYRQYKISPELIGDLVARKQSFPCPQMVVWLSEHLLLAQKKADFKKSNQEELAKAQNLFKAILENRFNVLHEKMCQELGFNTFLKTHGPTSMLIVMEKPEQATGRGFYVFNLSQDCGPILQLPHSFKDWYTSELGLLLFLEKNVKAACWNTVPRNTKPGEKPCDLARFHESYFTAFAKAYIDTQKECVLAQLHGFNPKKRKTPQGQEAEMIISPGARKTFPWFNEVLNNFKSLMPKEKIFGFPNEINELGGTLNSVSQIVHKLGHGKFLHLELAQSERIKLLDNKELRSSLAKALQN